MSHTPGPWRLVEISGPQPSNGAIVQRGDVQGVQIAPLADARLIAAAPDLLAVAESVAEIVGQLGADACSDFPALVAQARAAIAKAHPSGDTQSGVSQGSRP